MSGSLASGSSLLIQIQIAIVGVLIVLGIFFMWRAVNRIEQRLRIVEINQKTLSQCQLNPSLNLKSGGGLNGNPISCSMTTGVCLRSDGDQHISTFSTAKPSEFSEIDDFADEMVKVFGHDDREFDEEVDGHVEVDEDSDSDSKKATTTAKNIVITPIVTEPVVKVDAKPTLVDAKQISVDVKPTLVDAKPTLVDEVLSEADTEPGNPLSKSKLKAMSVEKLKSICTHHHLSVEGSKNVLISRILGEIRD
jgi:hypothetical protein